MLTPYVPGGRLGITNAAAFAVGPEALKIPQRNSARANGALPSALSTNGGRGVACAPAKFGWFCLTVSSMPAKLLANDGIELCLNDAESPRAIMSKYFAAVF